MLLLQGLAPAAERIQVAFASQQHLDLPQEEQPHSNQGSQADCRRTVWQRAERRVSLCKQGAADGAMHTGNGGGTWQQLEQCT